jgi:hypothetical protein
MNQTTITGTRGTWGIWKVNMKETGNCEPRVDLIAIISEAIFLNGMTTIPSLPGEEAKESTSGSTVLVVDSTAGAVYAVKPSSGAKSLFHTDLATMLPAPNASIPLGINGIHYSKGKGGLNHLYYSGTTTSQFHRIPMSKSNTVEGPPQLLLSGTPLDDFTVRKDGTVYITTDPQNTNLGRGGNGAVTVIGGNGTTGTVFAGATAAKFGRASRDRDILYVTTGGGRLLALTV